MKLQPFILIRHDHKRSETIPVLVPAGSIFRHAEVMSDNITLFYEVPTSGIKHMSDTRTDVYKLLATDEEIPANYKFVQFLSSIVEVPVTNEKTKKVTKQQAIQIFPLYVLADVSERLIIV